jgi:carbon monoxide dehydrogenase subunit G
MQIEKSFVVNAPAPAVWEFLTDPRKVASCLPGAAITNQLDDGGYAGTMTVKVGPVTANYRGKMRFEKLDAEAGDAEIVASGQETRGKGGADMRMKSHVAQRPDGATEVTVVSDVNVVGVLAQFGRGMIQDVSDQLFQKFTDAMRRQLETPAAPAPAMSAGGAEAQPAPPATSEAATPSPPPPPPEPARMASVTPTPSPPTPTAEPALDLGALGAAAAGRAAVRTFQRPGFWIALIVLAVVIYFLFR